MLRGVSTIDPLVGTVLDGEYRIDARLAAGGFGAVYRATRLTTGREVALKVLRARIDDLVARFRREVEVLVHLHNRHTVAAFDYGEAADGTLYIVMELLRGETLADRYRARGPLPWRSVVDIAIQVCESLAEAHALGIVHRDLKPTNIHLEANDFVKVVDFGIAKIMHGSDLDGDTLTRSGQLVGTFDYMAPEQIVNSQCAPPTDLFALGLVIYEMIGGARAFGHSHSPTTMLQTIMTKAPAPLSSLAAVPRDLDVVIAKLLQPDARCRYANACELAAALVVAP